MKYIGYYYKGTERNAPLAGVNKMDYISEIISDYHHVEVISFSGVTGKASSKKSVEEIRNNISLRLFFSLGRKTKYVGKLSTLLIQIQAFVFLFLNVKRNETVVVYHSIAYCKGMIWLMKIKKFKLVLEVEEIYADVLRKPRLLARENVLFSMADSYIFPTQYLSKRVNTVNKPEIIIHGNYKTEQRSTGINNFKSEENSGQYVHCLYSGTLDPRKGCLNAVRAALFLPEYFNIHVLGFGSEQDVYLLQKEIDDISQHTKAKVSYDGLLTGKEYIDFVQSCHIGLCTQNPDAEFTDSSFPSKILTYLGNGLKVVSISIPTIINSDVSSVIFFYDNNNPQDIAHAIRQAACTDTNNSGGIALLSKLDKIARKKIIDVLI